MMIPNFLRFDYLIEKNYFFLPKFTLGSIGFYPGTPKTIYLQIWAAINFIALGYSCYAEFAFGMHFFITNTASAIDAFCPMTCSVTTLFKIACLWYYRDEFNFLICRVRKLLDEQNSDEKLKSKKFYYSLATRLVTWIFSLSTCTTAGYALRAIIVNVLAYYNGKSYVYATAFNMLFPDILLTMPYYPFTFLFTIWYGQITAAGFSGTDGLFLSFCLYFATLLKCLQIDVKNLLQERKDSTTDHRNDAFYHEKMKRIIERHCEIAELIHRFSNIVSAFTLFHFVSSSLVIGISVVCFLLYSDIGVIVYITYILGVITELFFYCLGGTALAEKALELGTETYCSSWFSQDVRTQKMVLLLILRSQESLIIRVPFFAPTLEAFISILRFTGSLVALASQFL